jgi:hypothetical protein
MIEAHHSGLFKLATRLLKYFLLVLLGIAIAYLISGTFGLLPMAWSLLQSIAPWLLRAAAVVGGIMAIAIIFESTRQ